MLKNSVFIVLIWLSSVASAQPVSVTGKVSGGSPAVPLPGANVYWSGTTFGTQTDMDGTFEISVHGELPLVLVISYVGFISDSIQITQTGFYPIELKAQQLEQVEVESRVESTMISTINPVNVEQVGKKELLKAACCNLSESFETNPSVNVSYSDAVTGAKEIQMLGLSGIYSQIMTENIPAMKGLAAPFGLGYVPGTWMESIQITKGSGSVSNGFESTTGQINVEYIKPATSDRLYVNLYGASTGNTELNTHFLIPASDKLSSVLFFHAESSPVKWDRQNDGFLDMPLVQQANVFNRWAFNDGKKFEGQFGVKVLAENRLGGQVDFNKNNDYGTTNHYGIGIDTRRIEAFSKTGLIYPETPWKSAGLILSGSFHDVDSYFGLNSYKGKQTEFYGSMIYMSIIKTTDHKFKSGIDFRYDDFNEHFSGSEYLKEEIVPGVYTEYTYSHNDKLTVVAGSRLDHHNTYGWFYTPRLHAKYNFTPEIILRISGGRSFRTANVLAENMSLMASSRKFILSEKLNPERAWNYGANITTRFTLDYRSGSVSADYYVTNFTDQVVVDMYSKSEEVLFYNLKGTSNSKSFQLAVNYELFKRFDVRLAYKHDVVVTDYAGVSTQKPLVAPDKALVNLAYATRKDIWKFDFTALYEGKKKLGIATNDQNQYNDSQVKNSESPAFLLFNSQITYKLNKWDIYVGSENIGDFRQLIPVLGYNDPFGSGFDATNVWGPVNGRKIYAGVRYAIPVKKKSN
ncbi:MAG TPA: TonB-dependent receptor [Bacteroidia bacterium]|nr:TonB-dependent receptor [Bacteroidia bacterium]